MTHWLVRARDWSTDWRSYASVLGVDGVSHLALHVKGRNSGQLSGVLTAGAQGLVGVSCSYA